MLLLALSCLQGRLMADAAAALLETSADGLQLTPGCAPSPDFVANLGTLPVRTHHGFSEVAMRHRVWDTDGNLLRRADSIHPPKAAHAAVFFEQAEAGVLDGVAVEIMFPGYTLGDGRQVERAMELGLALAVDVSHLHIQRTAGVIDEATVRRVLAYDHIFEAHVSANDGRRDSHHKLHADTWGLDWARERLSDGTVVVLESYMHHLTAAERADQVTLIRERLST